MYSKFVKRTIITALIFIVFTALPVSSQVRYNVIGLGGLPGYEDSYAWAINNNGIIVGEAWNGSTNRAVLFDASGAGNNIDLGSLGATVSRAVSVNNYGQIVGTATQPSPLVYFATVFDPTGNGNNVGLVANSAACKINDGGQIAGCVNLNFDGTISHAALFDLGQQGSYIDLGSLPNYNVSQAYSINNAGTIVGYSYNYNPSDFYYFYRSRAVLFDSTDPAQNIDLGTLGGYNYAVALSVNDNGQIVGRVNNDNMEFPNNYFPRAVLFNPNDSNNNLDLGGLPGYDSAEAFSINNRGQILGRALINDFTGISFTPVLFDPSGQGNNINLMDAIDTTSEWYLNTALCLNDNGWIVGIGGHNGYVRACLLVPIPAGPADFDQNGKVDFYDFAKFAAAWDAAFWDENYNLSCDLETDGQINYGDLAIFVDGWSPDL